MINVRATAEEKRQLKMLAQSLDVRGEADVVRLALDYFLEHAPAARAALRARAAKG